MVTYRNLVSSAIKNGFFHIKLLIASNWTLDYTQEQGKIQHWPSFPTRKHHFKKLANKKLLDTLVLEKVKGPNILFSYNFFLQQSLNLY